LFSSYSNCKSDILQSSIVPCACYAATTANTYLVFSLSSLIFSTSASSPLPFPCPPLSRPPECTISLLDNCMTAFCDSLLKNPNTPHRPTIPLTGGSPWEVPFAQLVGENSYETLGKLYTGYGQWNRLTWTSTLYSLLGSAGSVATVHCCSTTTSSPPSHPHPLLLHRCFATSSHYSLLVPSHTLFRVSLTIPLSSPPCPFFLPFISSILCIAFLLLFPQVRRSLRAR
jgi:hypothetical protein